MSSSEQFYSEREEDHMIARAEKLVFNRICHYLPESLLSGLQRMAVAAYFPFDNRLFPNGDTATWQWALNQWDKVAAAGDAVRLVVADQSYSELQQSNGITDMQNRFQACRAARQLVFGYVHCRFGKIPLGTTGQTYTDAQGNTWPVVRDQVDAWKTMYGSGIDGIYIDEGPTDCDPSISSNYQNYVSHIRSYGYQVFLLTPQYPDNLSTNPGWLRNLNADYLALWEEGVTPYQNNYWHSTTAQLANQVSVCQLGGDLGAGMRIVTYILSTTAQTR